MASMNISLPDPMRDFVQRRIEEGQYASSSDYVRDLIRKDQEQRDGVSALRALLQEGVDLAFRPIARMISLLRSRRKAAH